MMEQKETPSSLTLIDTHHPLKRVIFAAIGCAIIVGVVVALGPGLWPPSIVTPFFAIIFAGGLSVGGTLLVTSVFGDNTVMQVDTDRITIQRSNPWRHRVATITPNQISDVIVHTNDWESRNDTYEVRVLLTDGGIVRGADLADLAAAELQAATLRRLTGKRRS